MTWSCRNSDILVDFYQVSMYHTVAPVVERKDEFKSRQLLEGLTATLAGVRDFRLRADFLN